MNLHEKECSRCGLTKAINYFSKDKSHKSKHKSACKECAKLDFYKWKSNNYEKSKLICRKTHYKTTYNLSDSEATQLAIDRTGVCAICSTISLLVVDHCHTTGKVRGLICSSCNSLLGYSKDNINTLEKSIQYLKDFYE